jgi:hypothetical protein
MSARRPLVATLIAAVVLLAFAGQAMAGRQWCKKDPVFLVAGTRVTVEVGVPVDDQGRVTGAVGVVLSVPKGIAASLISTDDGFGGQSEFGSVAVSDRLRVSRTGVPIQVAVTVPATSRTVLVNVVVTPDKGRSGSANGSARAQISVGATVAPTS